MMRDGFPLKQDVMRKEGRKGKERVWRVPEDYKEEREEWRGVEGRRMEFMKSGKGKKVQEGVKRGTAEQPRQ